MSENCNISFGSNERKSSFPMVSVDEAINIIFSVISTSLMLTPQYLSLMDSHGCVVAEDIYAQENFPPWRASIMDGYAVVAPIEEGSYPVKERIHAGSEPMFNLTPGVVSYITTGARLPIGANAVIKIEDTEAVNDKNDIKSSVDEKFVLIKKGIKSGVNIREVGSDIGDGELIMNKGQVIKAAEIGLLATAGITKILCYPKPVIGVISTGSELVDPLQSPAESQIRDCNRAALLCAFAEDGYKCIDIGIVKDLHTDLREKMQFAAANCDVVVTTGGISMGEVDLLKPLLQDMGTIHFGRLNMKPGKPTTFATLASIQPSSITSSTNSSKKQCCFFALPGNPASALVTKTLLVNSALKRMQGILLCSPISHLMQGIPII